MCKSGLRQFDFRADFRRPPLRFLTHPGRPIAARLQVVSTTRRWK
jgi:hypothetical protein